MTTAVILVAAERPKSVEDRHLKFDAFINAVENAKAAVNDVRRFRTESEERVISKLPPAKGLDDYSLLRIHRFNAQELLGCETCSTHFQSKDDVSGLARTLRQVDEQRQEKLAAAATAIRLIRGPLRSLQRACKASAATMNSTHSSWEECIQEFMKPAKAERNAMRKGTTYEDLSWERAFPAEDILKTVEQALDTYVKSVTEIVAVHDAHDVVRAARLSSEKSRREAKAQTEAPSLQEASLPAAPEVQSEPAGSKGDPAASGRAVPAIAAGTEESAVVQDGANAAVEQAAAAERSDGPAAQPAVSEETADKLPPLEEASLPASVEQSVQTPASAGMTDEEFIYQALETYVTDRQQRAEVASKLSLRAFYYRMPALERAFPNLEGIPDSNLYAIQAVLDRHPDVLLMPAEKFEEYVRLGARAAELRRKLPELGGEAADPEKQPDSFSTAGGLAALVNRLEERVEYHDLKDALAAKGYEPEAAMTVLRYGFYYGGALHAGNRLIPRDTMVRQNVEHYLGHGAWNRLKLERTFTRLIQDGAISTKVGSGAAGYSLNNAGLGKNGPGDKALVDAVQWVIRHHKMPRESFE